MDMQTEIISETNTTVVRLEGEFDMYAARDAGAGFIECLEKDPAVIIVNMEKVDYIDSSGIGVIIRLLQKAGSRGINLRFTGLQPAPKKVFELSNIISLLDLYESEEKALSV